MLISSSSRYSIYKVQCPLRSRVSLLILSHPIHFVKNFFQVFSKFFKCFRFFRRPRLPRGNFAMLPHPLPFVKHYFRLFSNNSGAPFGAPEYHLYRFISHHRSDRSRHLSDGRQRRRNRYCPHRGKRRNHAPKDSSGGWPLPGS